MSSSPISSLSKRFGPCEIPLLGSCQQSSLFDKLNEMANIFASLTALSYGIANFSGGVATRKSDVLAVMVWSQLVGVLVGLAVVPLVSDVMPTTEAWLWGMASGLSGGVGLMFFYQGLAAGFASIVSPVAAITGAAVPVLFGLIVGERPEPITWLGVAISIPAILLLSSRQNDSAGRVSISLRMGFLAGLGFGGFFILISRGSGESGLWPLIAARSASIPMLLTVALVRRRPLHLQKGSRAGAATAGIMDMVANLFFILATRFGILISASIIAGLHPAPTVLLQRIIFHEKLGRLRIAGVILALAGITLIGIK